MILRPAEEEDCRFFYDVRQATRAVSTQNGEITWDDHRWWWEHNPGFEHRYIIIARDGKRAGVLRMAWNGRVSIALLNIYQGQGLGTEALRALIPLARAKNIWRLTAEVRSENTRSLRAFAAAGWQEMARLLEYQLKEKE